MARKQPERMCIACRNMKPKRELFRLVVQDGRVVVDETGKLPGRGAYLCKDRTCLNRAIVQKRLQQHLRCRPGTEDLENLEMALATLEAEQNRIRAEAEKEARLAAMPAVAVGDRLGQTVRIKKKGGPRDDRTE